MLVFDGYCNLCIWLVRLVKRFDKGGKISLVNNHEVLSIIVDSRVNNDTLSRSVLFVSKDFHVSQNSDAILKTFRALGGGWQIFWLILVVIPRPIRDFFYKIIAKYRHKIFGRRDSCYIP